MASSTIFVHGVWIIISIESRLVWAAVVLSTLPEQRRLMQLSGFPTTISERVSSGPWWARLPLAMVAFTAGAYLTAEVVPFGPVGAALVFAAFLFAVSAAEYATGVESLPDWLISKHDIRRPTERDLKLVVVGLASAIVGVVVIVSIVDVIGTSDGVAGHSTAEQAIQGELPTDRVLWFVVSAVVLAPIAEELVFRNGIQKAASRYIGPWPAIIATSALFAAIHIPSYGGLGQPAMQLTPALAAIFLHGAIYGWVYQRTKNILTAMATHSLWNLVTVLPVFLA